MWRRGVFVLTFVVCLSGQLRVRALQDVTTDLFGSEFHGTVAAFGDFNSDKQTDIFIIRQQSELVIFLADLTAPYFKPKVHLPKDLFGNVVIDGVVPGDFDGDSQMDVLLTTHPNSQNTDHSRVTIFWGNNQTLGRYAFGCLPCVHCSFDGDMIPDVFGSTSGTVTEVCYLKGSVLHSSKQIRIPHSNAFVDLNRDFTAGKLMLVFHYPRSDFKVLGQSAFVDFDGDGSQDHLLPVCMDDTCKRSAIYLTKPGDSQVRRSAVSPRGWEVRGQPHVKGCSLVPKLSAFHPQSVPPPLLLTLVLCSSAQQAFLLENVPCSNASCREAGRMFRVHWDQSDLSSVTGAAVAATFFDIYEDGILDMIVLSKEVGKEELTIHALKNNFEADAYFVKVIVLSGLCSNDCPGKVKPFGVNQPGPYVMYTSVDSNGYLKNASAGQLSQSAHLSLQLPYTVLGLGRSANFLDHLYVGIPRPSGDGVVRKQEWTAIIPNSQLIVIPYPHDDPRSWSAKLYLTPSNIVLLTAIALIGVCIFILVIIGILHWQEKKADDREKRQEAHRFHFDAM
ncbi:T-cell immunomodulatory protein [Arapaima gigas]